VQGLIQFGDARSVDGSQRARAPHLREMGKVGLRHRGRDRLLVQKPVEFNVAQDPHGRGSRLCIPQGRGSLVHLSLVGGRSLGGKCG